MKIWKNNILGVNYRNLKYVIHNHKDAINFANNKIKTKHFLSVRGIPVPKLIAIFKTREDVNKFDFASLNKDFVIKPNKGSQGKGIIPFKERKGDKLISVSNKEYSIRELKNHILNIIQGIYNEGNADTAFLEQRIKNSPELEEITYKGLPDVRVICYNQIPVMAMLRVPTKESEGRANLAENAMGIGINLSNGEPTYYYYNGKISKKDPLNKKSIKRIPNFIKVLQICVKCAQLSKLKFIGCDIAFNEKNEPCLIEINARSGLKIQLANKDSLKERIQKIENLKPKSINESIEIAMSIFGGSYKKLEFDKQKIIGLEEKIKIFNEQKIYIADAKLKLVNKQNFIDEALLKKMNIKDLDAKNYTFKISLKDETQQLVFYKSKLQDTDILLGKNAVENFLIDPKKAKSTNLPKYVAEKKVPYITNTHNYGEIDHKIYKIEKSLGFNKKITPINYIQEINKFKEDHNYNPQFLYNDYTDLIYELNQKLESIKIPDTQIGKIFQDKVTEIKYKLNCLEFLGTKEFSMHYAKLIPFAQKSEILKAQLYLQNDWKEFLNEGKKYTQKEAIEKFQNVIEKYNLNFKIEVEKDAITRMKVTSKGKIKISSLTDKLTKRQVDKLIAHEIETHALTYANGDIQPYKIFNYGFANYIELQEGLAIYNQERKLNIDHNYYASNNFIGNKIVLENSFSEAYKLLKEMNLFKNPINFIARCKKGISNTKQTGGNTKQLVYFRGAIKIRELIEKNPKILNTLYLGKINFESLNILKKADFINNRIQLPEFLINNEESPKE